MNPHETSWLPGIVVFAMGGLGAVLYLVFGRRSPAAAPTTTSLSSDPEQRYQTLLAQLTEHAGAKHLMSAEAWSAEQRRLELAAANILRERDGKKHDQLKAEARAARRDADRAAETGFLAKNPLMRGLLIGVGVVAFFAVLGVLLVNQSEPRTEGREMTGVNPNAAANRGPMQQQPEAEDPRLAQLQSLAQRNPEDVEILSQVSGEYLKRQMYQEAVPLVMQASALDPFQVKTRVHRAVLDAVGGTSTGDEALTELIHLADYYDGAWEARMYAGALALDMGNQPLGLSQLERYMVEAPVSEQPPMIRRTVEMIKARMNSPQPTAPPDAPSPFPKAP